MDRTKYGPWALIAGGSEGLGASFADQLASEGFNLVLLGRKEEPLEETAALARKANVEVRTLSVDLTSDRLLEQVRPVTDDVEVGLLIYNAGANSYGHEFIDGDLERFRSVVDVNVPGRLTFCHHFGGLMKERRRGGMILVGSMAGFRGTPVSCIYNAAKAFTRVFAEGLWYELKEHGIDVVEFVVGPMRTPAMARRGMKFGPEVVNPDDVAREGLKHILDGPVLISEFVGGVPEAERLQSFPRGPMINDAADLLRNLGLYPPKQK